MQPLSFILKNDIVYQNALQAISQIRYSHTPGTDTFLYSGGDPDVKKHVALLDLVALLLGYAEGDVVATGLDPQQDGTIVVVWAKNKPDALTNEEDDYLRKLQKSFRDLDHPTATLGVVVRQCRRKVTSRVKKFAKGFQTSSVENTFGVNEQDAATQAFRQYLVDAHCVKPDPLVVILNRFYWDCKLWGTHNTEDEKARIVYMAYWLSCGRITLKGLPGINDEDFRKIQKIGAYFLACLKIHQTLKHSQHRNNFSLHKLAVPKQTTFYPYADTVDAANVWTKRQNLPPIKDFPQIKAKYQDAQAGQVGLPPPSTIKVIGSQHCELTVALYLWKAKATGHIEIGCNKASCFYCAKWIDEFNLAVATTNRSVIHRGDHRKFINGWVVPQQDNSVKAKDNMLEDVLATVGDRLRSEIGWVMNSIASTIVATPRKADSHSPPSNIPWEGSEEEHEESAMENPWEQY
ncbi:MAG: hypothetical protein Q9169_002347 [Polycauliona sp. 2 TL-2023]